MSKIWGAKILQILQMKLIPTIANGNYARIKFSKRPIKKSVATLNTVDLKTF